ncbi:hypothetical protein [Azospirillum brasilense]|uniref:hypothetical protein n=1 Tax=Azospirillum brasilense TaxID=192 RepID=UPI001177551C|nr:hypothetical protein [Azospirillum brasilense]
MNHPQAERIGAPEAARISGLSLRTIQHRAADIPGAAKLFGRWTFDVERLRRWINDQEAQTKCQPISTNAAPSGGPAYRPAGPSTDDLYARLIGRRRNADSTKSRRKSAPLSTSESRA